MRYSEPCQICRNGLFAKVTNDWKLLTIFEKRSIFHTSVKYYIMLRNIMLIWCYLEVFRVKLPRNISCAFWLLLGFSRKGNLFHKEAILSEMFCYTKTIFLFKFNNRDTKDNKDVLLFYSCYCWGILSINKRPKWNEYFLIFTWLVLKFLDLDI